MESTTATTSPANPAAAQQPSNQATAEQGTLTSDFETFLQMLTTQIQNQDPMDPMDSSEFASQLATFSSVEQQVRTNDLLTGLQNTMTMSNVGQLGNWVGMEARAEMPMYFDGQPLTLLAQDHSLADGADLVVTDELGNSIQRLSLPQTGSPFEWAGVASDGGPLPPGVYGFHIDYFSGETAIESRPAMGYAEIQEAQIINGEIWLNFPGGVQVNSGMVDALR